MSSQMYMTLGRGPAKELQVACLGSAPLLLHSEVQHNNSIACAGQQPSRIIQQRTWLQSAAREHPVLGTGLQQDAHACSSQVAGQEAQQAADISRAAVGALQAAQQAASTFRAAVDGPPAAWHLQGTSADLQGVQAASAVALTSMAGNGHGDETAPEQQLPAIRRR